MKAAAGNIDRGHLHKFTFVDSGSILSVGIKQFGHWGEVADQKYFT
jgi:hypothetical protein